MNENIFETVLQDILDELQQANTALKEMRGVVSELTGKVEGFEQQLKDQQVIAPPADVEAVKQVVAGGLEGIRAAQAEAVQRMTAIVEAQPKNVVRQWRLAIFPGEDRVGNYKHFINRLSLVGILGGLILAMFVVGMHWLDQDYAFRAMYERTSPASVVVARPGGQVSAPPAAAASTEKAGVRPRRDRRRMDTLYKKYIHPYSDSLRDSGR